MKKYFTLFLLLLLTGCSQTTEQPVETDSFQMGTVITQRIYGKNTDAAMDAVEKRLTEIENTMTINKVGGEINKLNDMAGSGQWVSVGVDTMEVLSTANKFAALSEGAFDITIGPLVKAWGIYTDTPKVLTESDAADLKQLVNYKDLLLDEKNSKAQLKRKSQIVDLGGIAKGYAGDEAIDIYKAQGITSAYVNLGGNVVVLGTKPDKTRWKIGVQNPRGVNGETIAILQIANKAVVTSGDYERFFEKDGVRYHHIIDSKTGYPSKSDLLSATIVADRSIEADALSTVAFILGLNNGMKLIESLPGIDAVFITSDKKVYITSGLKDTFKMNDESKEYQYVEKR